MNRLAGLLSQQHRALVLASFTVFLDNLLLSMIIPIIPFYIDKFGASQSQIGLLFAIDAAGLLITTPFWGIVSDRYGRKFPIIFGLIGLAVSTVFLGFGTNLTELYIARLLQGICSAATWTSSLALLADFSPSEERGKSMGIVMASISVGSLLGSPIGGLLFETGGFSFPFTFTAFLIVLDLLGFIFLLKFPSVQPQEKLFIVRFLKNPKVIILSAIVLVSSSTLSIIDPILPAFFEKTFAASPLIIGLLFGTATLADGISSYISGYISDRTNKYAVMIIGLIFIAITFPFLVLSKFLWQEFLAVFFVGASVGIALTPIMPAMAEIVDDEKSNAYASIYAIFDMFFALSFLVGPLIGGFLADLFGIKYTIFLASGFIVFFILFLVCFFNIFTKKTVS